MEEEPLKDENLKQNPIHKNILALISIILTGLYLVYSAYYWLGVVGNTGVGFAEYTGSFIATALVVPHLLCILIGFVFNCLGYFLNKKNFILVAAILYAVSIVLFISYFMFIIVQMILCFVSYATFDNVKAPNKNTLHSNGDLEESKTTNNKNFSIQALFKNKVVVICTVLVVCILGFSTFNIYSTKQNEKMAQDYLNSEEYSESLDIYKKLSKNATNTKYKDEITKLNSLVEDEKSYNTAVEHLTNKETLLTLRSLNKIKNKDEFENKISEISPKIISAIAESVNLHSNSGEYAKLIDSLSKLEVESTNFSELNQYISSTKSSVENIAKTSDYYNELNTKLDSLKTIPKNDYSSLVGTFNYVTSSNANVRSGPGFSYPIIYNLSKGDSVYISDTKYADERIWCNIGDGWVSINTINGAIN